jgi:hypothetical protein
MAAELWPPQTYLLELRAIWSSAQSDSFRGSAHALLDLVAHVMVPVRAAFYIIVVNVLFFAYCYRALTLALTLTLKAAAAS